VRFQKYTPTDCFFSDFAHWVDLGHLHKTQYNQTEVRFQNKENRQDWVIIKGTTLCGFGGRDECKYILQNISGVLYKNRPLL